MTRRVTRALAGGAVLFLVAVGMVVAAQTPSGPARPTIDPKALEVLKAMDEAFGRAEGLAVTYRMEYFRPNGQRGQGETTSLHLGRPNVYLLETTAPVAGVERRTIIASDGTTRYTLHSGNPARCTTWKVSPRNESRELDTFNPIYWSFYGLGEWQIRSAMLGHWITTWRLRDPGLRAVRYLGVERPAGEPLDVVEWSYTIGYNRPEDAVIYTSRLWIGADHFPHRIETTSTSKNEYEGRRIVETMNDIRTTARAPVAAFAYRPPDGTVCRAEDPEGPYTTGAFADLPIGSKAPDFTLKTARGETFRLYDFLKHHKIVLMNYWGYG